MIIHVLVAFRNRPDLLARCLRSLIDQDDPDYRVHVADDASTDPVVAEVYDEFRGRMPEGSTWANRPEHYGTLRSQVTVLRDVPMAPEDCVAWVDGDDRLAHPRVLSTLRAVYADPLVDLCYGSYLPDPPSSTCPPVREIPADVCAEGRYRSWHARYGCRYNHLRTARRRLFDAMDDDANFVRDGAWLQCAPDHALFVPFLELAGGRHRMIEEPLLIYTSDRPDAEWRTRGAEITSNTQWILGLPPYSPLPPMEVA